MTGIYLIHCIKTRTYYIGQALDIERRLNEHFSRSKYLNGALYEDIRKYGADNFSSSVLEIVRDPSQLDKAEAKWIKIYGSKSKLYNRTNGAKQFQNIPSLIQLDWEMFIKASTSCRPATLKYAVYLSYCNQIQRDNCLDDFCVLFNISKSTAYAAQAEYLEVFNK